MEEQQKYYKEHRLSQKGIYLWEQINKFGYTYPRRLLRSPTLVGHQDYFLAPLPGSIAISIRSLGKYSLAFYLLYHACYQWLVF